MTPSATEKALIFCRRTGKTRGNTDVDLIYARVLESDRNAPIDDFLAIDVVYRWDGECDFFLTQAPS